MKRLIMAMFVITIGAGLYAQDSFFPSKAGITLTYANNDARGNTEGYTVLTIKDVKGSGNNITITYTGASLDKSRKLVKGSEMIYKAVVKNGVLIMDINRLVPVEMREQGIKIEAKGLPMELPNDIKPGQSLKDCWVTAKMDLGVMTVSNTIRLTEGKCLAIENVKVPAGTFKCHKITQKYTATAGNITVFSTSVSWYAPNIGEVKNETYDENKKLVSTSVLVELKGR